MYKLIQPVDPTTKNVPIRKRFAKLTLSSNKKKEEKTSPDREIIKTTARRSLISEYSRINPLLKTNSDMERSEFMEPLQISEEEKGRNSSDDDLDVLSQKISHLALKKEGTESIVIETTESDDHSTLEESEFEDTDNSAITISSSEESTISKKDVPFDCNLVTSSVMVSGETENALLPCTLSNDRADRIEAYLRDVSQQNNHDWQHNNSVDLSIVDGDNDVEEKKNETEATEATLPKTNLASADTELMSTISQNVNNSIRNTVMKERDLKLDDTIAMTETQFSFFEKGSISQKMQEHIDRSFSNKSRGLALDDTEENTLYDDNSDHDTIPETASEHSGTSSSNIISEVSNEKGMSAIENNEDEDCNNAIDGVPIQKPDMQIELGNINISAKIKIKIQISKLNLESSDSENAEDSNNVSDQEGDVNVEISTDTPKRCDRKQAANADDNISEDINTKPDFMTHAEKLLNQLYGQSWQTPEVIKTLKGSKKNDDNRRIKTIAHDISYTNEADKLDQTEIDDFSIFRRNVNTNLDSTRITPKRNQPFLKKSTYRTEPRKQLQMSSATPSNRKKMLPQTELKKKSDLQTQRSEKWRQLVDEDNDSMSNCASDDSDIDETKSNNSDPSWSDDSLCNSIVNTDSKAKKKKSTSNRNITARKQPQTNNNQDKLVYLDLSKHEVSVMECTPKSPGANRDSNFQTRLANILRTCKAETKTKLPATPKSTCKTKRKLFTFDLPDEMSPAPCPATPKFNKKTLTYDDDLLTDDDDPKENNEINFQILDKRVNALKGGSKPIFTITPPKAKSSPKTTNPRMKKPLLTTDTTKSEHTGTKDIITQLQTPLHNKYGFLKSLDVCVSKSLCHTDALVYRENYRTKKEELAKLLYDLFNTNLFNGSLNVPLVWNKKLSNTAGRCLNKKKNGIRSSVVELSEKVLTSADRLRCTLIHELCHAATWIFNGEGGHGKVWKSWAQKAMTVFPELPKISTCHQYDIEYKYTYRCTLCDAKSYAHSKSKKVENIRCSYCHGAIEIFLNKKDKMGNIVPTPIKEPTAFAKFVKENYKQFKQPEMKHGDVMKQLGMQFANIKVAGGNIGKD